MNVAVIGLGLIGGSFAKAVKAYTDHRVFGMDASEAVEQQAAGESMLDGLVRGNLGEMDLTLVALYPRAAVDYLTGHAAEFRPGSVVVDLCGVKRYVCERVRPVFEHSPVTFIGGHPMAGLEVSGYFCSRADLYREASMILTPYPDTPLDQLELVRRFFLSVGFGSITVTTPAHHDEVIAYTSQLAHAVSSSYIQSPSAEQNRGFSAGSYKDLTRVAKLNEHMWAELFMCNGDCLAREIDEIVSVLQSMSGMLRQGQEEALRDILAAGSRRKQIFG